MSPEYVRPYVKAQKNDDRDAEAIAEAATRPTMRFVELKSEAQLDMQTLHRARERLVGERTALINQLRAILLERGIAIAQGRRKLEKELAERFGEEGGLPVSPRTRALVEDMRAQWAELDRRIEAFDDERRVRAGGADRRGGAALGDRARHRRAERDRTRGGGRRWRELRPRARPCRLAWPRAAPSDHGRKAAPARHQQARQRLPAQAADPRRALGLALACGQRDAARRVAARAERTDAPERRRGRLGQQAGADRLGGAAQRHGVQRRRHGCAGLARIGRRRPARRGP